MHEIWEMLRSIDVISYFQVQRQGISIGVLEHIVSSLSKVVDCTEYSLERWIRWEHREMEITER